MGGGLGLAIFGLSLPVCVWSAMAIIFHRQDVISERSQNIYRMIVENRHLDKLREDQ